MDFFPLHEYFIKMSLKLSSRVLTVLSLIRVTHPSISRTNKQFSELENKLFQHEPSRITIHTPSGRIPGQIVSQAVLGLSGMSQPPQPVTVVTIPAERSVKLGDSGSWAYRGGTGIEDPMGMLIGACPDLNECYLLNMELILEDIHTQLGISARVQSEHWNRQNAWNSMLDQTSPPRSSIRRNYHVTHSRSVKENASQGDLSVSGWRSRVASNAESSSSKSSTTYNIPLDMVSEDDSAIDSESVFSGSNRKGPASILSFATASSRGTAASTMSSWTNSSRDSSYNSVFMSKGREILNQEHDDQVAYRNSPYVPVPVSTRGSLRQEYLDCQASSGQPIPGNSLTVSHRGKELFRNSSIRTLHPSNN